MPITSKASANITVSTLPNEVRANFSGALDYTPTDESAKWVYKKIDVSSSTIAALDFNDYFLGTTTNLSNTDKVHWIGIKCTSTKDGYTENSSRVGILLNHTGGAPTYGGTGSTSSLVIAPNDLFCCKPHGVECQNLQIIAAPMTGDDVTGVLSPAESVHINILALVEDI